MIYILQHIDIEGPGYIEDSLAGREYSVVKLYEGAPVPAVSDECEACFVLGGPMNVYQQEEYPFLGREIGFIRNLISESVPLMGICLGSQLLAVAAGAKVRRARVPEIGAATVEFLPEAKKDKVFNLFSGEVDIFQWHEDTFDLPGSAVLLAKGRNCENQLFRVGKNAYGLQFHFEASPAIISEWNNTYLDEDGNARLSTEMMAGIMEKDAYFGDLARKITSGFLGLID